MNQNRNLWSKAETDTLVELCLEHGPTVGSMRTAKHLGRTGSACFAKWGKERVVREIPSVPRGQTFNVYQERKKEDSKSTNPTLNTAAYKQSLQSKFRNAKPTITSLSSSTMKVTYHNGSTHAMNIIAQTDGLVVAKINDVVVTIEM